MAGLRLHERIENGDELFVGDAATSVGNTKAHARPLRLKLRFRVGRLRAFDLHRDAPAGGRKLDGVRQKIYQNLSRPLVVSTINRGWLRDRVQVQVEIPGFRLRLNQGYSGGHGTRRR